jgi:uncharacterized membrane protein (UPF0127 family)
VSGLRTPLACLVFASLSACVAPPRSAEWTDQGAETARVAAPTDPRQAQGVVLGTASGPLRVSVELAVTPEGRRKGLMGRTAMPPGHGMLFVFDAQVVQTFWMRNTLIPLDMIFISGPPSGEGARVVGIVHGAQPHSTEIRSVPQASRFVLEVAGGWARQRGVAAGVEVSFEGSR